MVSTRSAGPFSRQWRVMTVVVPVSTLFTSRFLTIGCADQLGSNELCIEAVLLQQFMVIALFHGLTVIQHNDAVGIADGR